MGKIICGSNSTKLYADNKVSENTKKLFEDMLYLAENTPEEVMIDITLQDKDTNKLSTVFITHCNDKGEVRYLLNTSESYYNTINENIHIRNQFLYEINTKLQIPTNNL